MIVLPHINGITQGEAPTAYVACHSNATEIIYFENKEEYEEYKEKYFPKNEEING